MITEEYLLSKGFKKIGIEENDIHYRVFLKGNKNLSPTDLIGSFSSLPDKRFTLYNDNLNFKECTKERLEQIIKGIELLNNCNYEDLIIK